MYHYPLSSLSLKTENRRSFSDIYTLLFNLCNTGHKYSNDVPRTHLTTNDLKRHAVLTVTSKPLHLKGIVADEILKVQHDGHQAVQLIGQPEVRKAHMVKRRCEDAELMQKSKREILLKGYVKKQ